MIYKDIVVLESETKKIYGLRVRTGGLMGTDVIISEDGSMESKDGWKQVDISGFLLCYRTYKIMKQVADRLEKENQPWFDIRTRMNEADVPYPYTLGIICEKSKLNELDEFLNDWEGFDGGLEDVDIYNGETRIKELLEMTPIEVQK